MRILVTGCRGQLGFELRRALAPFGGVIATDVAECDLASAQAIRDAVRIHAPTVIVNAAAYTAVDCAESDTASATLINARAPGILAEEAEHRGALLVHYSTDYVFDGAKQGAYTESDTPNPLGVYGVTKLAGETAVLQGCQRHFVLRTGWVVGAHGNNFAKTMLRLAAERDSIGVVADQHGAPTAAALLADITALIIAQEHAVPNRASYGLYHATASGVTSWHAYACHVIERARAAGLPVRVPPGGIRAIASHEYATEAKRPANSVLDCSKLQAAFGLRLPPWQEGVDHVLDQLFSARSDLLGPLRALVD